MKIVIKESSKLADKGVQCMMVGYAKKGWGCVLYVEPGYQMGANNKGCDLTEANDVSETCGRKNGWMPEEIDMAILELQGLEEPEETQIAQDELAEEDKDPSQAHGLIVEVEPEEEENLPRMAEEKIRWVWANTLHVRPTVNITT